MSNSSIQPSTLGFGVDWDLRFGWMTLPPTLQFRISSLRLLRTHRKVAVMQAPACESSTLKRVGIKAIKTETHPPPPIMMTMSSPEFGPTVTSEGVLRALGSKGLGSQNLCPSHNWIIVNTRAKGRIVGIPRDSVILVAVVSTIRR